MLIRILLFIIIFTLIYQWLIKPMLYGSRKSQPKESSKKEELEFTEYEDISDQHDEKN